MAIKSFEGLPHPQNANAESPGAERLPASGLAGTKFIQFTSYREGWPTHPMNSNEFHTDSHPCIRLGCDILDVFRCRCWITFCPKRGSLIDFGGIEKRCKKGLQHSRELGEVPPIIISGLAVSWVLVPLGPGFCTGAAGLMLGTGHALRSKRGDGYLWMVCRCVGRAFVPQTSLRGRRDNTHLQQLSVQSARQVNFCIRFKVASRAQQQSS